MIIALYEGKLHLCFDSNELLQIYRNLVTAQSTKDQETRQFVIDNLKSDFEKYFQYIRAREDQEREQSEERRQAAIKDIVRKQDTIKKKIPFTQRARNLLREWDP